MLEQIRAKWVVVTLLVVLVLSMLALSIVYNMRNEYVLTKIVRYEFEVQNKTGRLKNNLHLIAYAPVPESSFVKVRNITASMPFSMIDDGSGNHVLQFKLDKLPPYTTKIITITSTLGIAERPQPIPLGNKARYLEKQKYVETDDSQLRNLSRKLAGDTSYDTLKNIQSWVTANVRYAGYIRDDRGALYAYKKKRGDCTEYMYLFMALSRLNGIPTRGVGGYIAETSRKLKPESYHNWVEVFIDGKWRVIDPQNNRFLENEKDYIGFRYIDAESTRSRYKMRNTHQFVFTDNEVEVRLN